MLAVSAGDAQQRLPLTSLLLITHIIILSETFGPLFYTKIGPSTAPQAHATWPQISSKPPIISWPLLNGQTNEIITGSEAFNLYQ